MRSTVVSCEEDRRACWGGDEELKLVLVHDSVIAYGGAERTLEGLLSLFPEAPLYTAIFRPAVSIASVGPRPVCTSFLQGFPASAFALKPLFPLAFERFRLPPDTECVLSSSSGYAKGIRAPHGCLHISYVHTPLRRAWNPYHLAARRTPGGTLGRLVEKPLLAYLRRWDLASVTRVDHFVANSKNTALQIWQTYGREATVIHPPVRTSFFVPSREGSAGDYFLVVARLDPYKRVDLAIQAANALQIPLIVVGRGGERSRLERMAGASVTFLGAVDDATLRTLYQGCRALLFPGEEDFGIAPIEAQACGKPVIAISAGGTLETVVESVTGLFFRDQTSESLVEAIERFQRLTFDPGRIRQHALQFDEVHFQDRITAFLRKMSGSRGCP